MLHTRIIGHFKTIYVMQQSSQRSDNALKFAFDALCCNRTQFISEVFICMSSHHLMMIRVVWHFTFVLATELLNQSEASPPSQPLSLSWLFYGLFLNVLSMLPNHRHRPATLHTDEQNTYSTHTHTHSNNIPSLSQRRQTGLCRIPHACGCHGDADKLSPAVG